jgi:hypothetical protein
MRPAEVEWKVLGCKRGIPRPPRVGWNQTVFDILKLLLAAWLVSPEKLLAWSLTRQHSAGLEQLLSSPILVDADLCRKCINQRYRISVRRWIKTWDRVGVSLGLAPLM